MRTLKLITTALVMSGLEIATILLLSSKGVDLGTLVLGCTIILFVACFGSLWIWERFVPSSRRSNPEAIPDGDMPINFTLNGEPYAETHITDDLIGIAIHLPVGQDREILTAAMQRHANACRKCEGHQVSVRVIRLLISPTIS